MEHKASRKENPTASTNRQYKDSMFFRLFNNAEAMRELYGALSGTPLAPSVPVTINTLDGVLFNGRRNDISCDIAGKRLVLAEHQSTLNLNMPLRFLLYIARVYETAIKTENVYSTRRLTIPAPEFYVLYIGTAPCPERRTLRLSDMFGGNADGPPNPELLVTTYNINAGYNEALAARSPLLQGYREFVGRARQFLDAGEPPESAIHLAAKRCIEDNLLVDFLRKNIAEVDNMLLTEWDEDMALAVRSREAWEDGREDGLQEGEKRGLALGEKRGRVEGLQEGRVEGLQEGRRYVLDLVRQGLTFQQIQSLLEERR